MYPMFTAVSQFMATFQEFPPAQHPDSFSPTDALQKLHASAAGG